jgi:hypothetical protein
MRFKPSLIYKQHTLITIFNATTGRKKGIGRYQE